LFENPIDASRKVQLSGGEKSAWDDNIWGKLSRIIMEGFFTISSIIWHLPIFVFVVTKKKIITMKTLVNKIYGALPDHPVYKSKLHIWLYVIAGKFMKHPDEKIQEIFITEYRRNNPFYS